MKVKVNGYGLLPFRATECYKFRGDESLVQFRGEVKLPKWVTTSNGKRWVSYDYWYGPTEISVTYGTSPSEADADKLKSMITTFEADIDSLIKCITEECNGESCNNSNCTCKQVDEVNTSKCGSVNIQSFAADCNKYGENFDTTMERDSTTLPTYVLIDMQITKLIESLDRYDILDPAELEQYTEVVHTINILNKLR